VVGIVHAKQHLVGRGRRGHRDASCDEPAIEQGRANAGEALGALGMTWARVVGLEDRIDDQPDAPHHEAVAPTLSGRARRRRAR